jgi:hypothetical protein
MPVFVQNSELKAVIGKQMGLPSANAFGRPAYYFITDP